MTKPHLRKVRGGWLVIYGCASIGCRTLADAINWARDLVE